MKKKEESPLKKRLRQACDACADALLALWNGDGDEPRFSRHYGYWAADDPTGVFCYDDWFYISLTDIVYCIENGVTYEEYDEWTSYCTEAAEWGFTTPKLDAWHTGCPRVPEETFATLRARREQLDDLVEIVKNNPTMGI